MRLALAVTAFTVAILASIATEASAQTTLYACFVKNTGTVYRIKTAGTPTKCGTNHTEFSWNEEGQAGPQGPQGPQGAEGPQGPAGPDGWPGIDLSMYQATSVPGNVTVTAMCKAGQVLLSGGFWMPNAASIAEVGASASWPYYVDGAEPQYGWQVTFKNISNSMYTVRVYAWCRTAAND